MWLVTTKPDSDVCGSRAQQWLLEIHAPAVFPESVSAGSLLGVIKPWLSYEFESLFSLVWAQLEKLNIYPWNFLVGQYLLLTLYVWTIGGLSAFSDSWILCQFWLILRATEHDFWQFQTFTVGDWWFLSIQVPFNNVHWTSWLCLSGRAL